MKHFSHQIRPFAPRGLSRSSTRLSRRGRQAGPKNNPLLAPEPPTYLRLPAYLTTRVPWYLGTPVPACKTGLPTALTVHTSPAPANPKPQIWQRQDASASREKKLGPLQLSHPATLPPTISHSCTRRQPDPISSSLLLDQIKPSPACLLNIPHHHHHRIHPSISLIPDQCGFRFLWLPCIFAIEFRLGLFTVPFGSATVPQLFGVFRGQDGV